MPCNVATDIDCHGQACNMGRILLNVYVKSGGVSPKALRADAGFINGGKHILLQSGVKLIGVESIRGAAQRLFGKQGRI